MRRLHRLIHDATFLRKFHGWSTVAWFVAAFPICIWLNQSIPFLVWISVYAIVISHAEGWQTAIEMLKNQKKDERE
jgi:hypothetical protein